ncbi:MAG: hypothetical protein AAF138_05420 [Planctomycetota bacterium]
MNANKNHPDQLQLALCYHEYSKKKYRNDIDIAIKLVNKAVDIRSIYQDTVATLQSLYAAGYYYNLKGNSSKSIHAYASMLNYNWRGNLTAKAHNRLGLMHAKIGDFNKALMHFEKAESLFKQYKQSPLVLKNHMDILSMFSAMGWPNPEKAVYHLQQVAALSAAAKLKHKNKLIINQVFGSFYDEKKEYTKAITYYKKALEISTIMKDSAFIAMNCSNIGISYKKNGDYPNAMNYYTEGLRFSGHKASLKAPIYNNMGDYYLAKQAYKKALAHYQKAINYTLSSSYSVKFEDLPHIDAVKTSPHKLDLLSYLTDKANAWITYYAHDHQAKYLERALETFTIADQLVDVIRFESTEFQSKLFWRAQSADLYMKAVGACYELGHLESAFYFMEKNKALLLLEDLTHEKAKENAQLPEALSQREFALKRMIHLAEQDLNEAKHGTTANIDALRNAVDAIERRAQRFGRYAALRERRDRVVERLRPRRHERRLTLALSIDRRDRELLGLVPQVEPHRQDLDDPEDLRRTERLQPRCNAVEITKAARRWGLAHRPQHLLRLQGVAPPGVGEHAVQ